MSGLLDGGFFGGWSPQDPRAMQQAQLQATRSAQQAQWSGINPQMLQQYRPEPTEWELDYQEAMKELDAIAPGWDDDVHQ